MISLFDLARHNAIQKLSRKKYREYFWEQRSNNQTQKIIDVINYINSIRRNYYNIP